MPLLGAKGVMHALATPVLATTFADCPRCGGWARRTPDARAANRWRCRGCGWSGVVAPAGRA